ncbi:hypothetical protein IMG5_148500 [Ichthyophthirius multifiliis]|uniref:Transmembrane protein n=1 Tax=Ichthyophthirius multifiliis TaxID=5932 RepID=G0QYD6_ICHMU|nr:hypothetical protein IMG5_148500 [Ichthyophthirius multifiliis]EGR29769.1 hypothetical protein IMG5_148500 [Ichthyophthirius multifiliis]|eukprot:XP_004031005.1 hypothetical protein IMG5_148500 [Ichthyophthirius multifiliis]
MLKQMKVWLIIYNGEKIKDVILLLKLANLILIILNLIKQNILVNNNALHKMMAMEKLLKVVSWIIAKILKILFIVKIIKRKNIMISINCNIMELILDAFILLLIMEIVIPIEILVVITLYALLILLILQQIFPVKNFKNQYAINKMKESKQKSFKENQNLVTLLVLIIQENFAVIKNVLIIVIKRVSVQMDNVYAHLVGRDLNVVFKQNLINNLFQMIKTKNVFNNVPRVNLQILIKYVENSVLMVITKIIQIIYVLSVICHVQNVLVLQRMIAQNAVS